MHLIFSTKPSRQIKPILASASPVSVVMKKENKRELSNNTVLFAPTPLPSSFQFMVERIQYTNPHCNSCGK